MTLQRNYIDGAWAEGHDVIVDQNPSDLSEPVGEYARADRDDVRRAVAAARAAVPAARQSSPQERTDILHAVGQELLDRSEELGTLLAREEGKTRAEGIAETVRAGNIFRFFAGEAVRVGGDIIPSVRPAPGSRRCANRSASSGW